MNNKLIIAATLPILITLGLQAYMLYQLNKQVSHLSGQINQARSPQMALPTFSTFTPVNPGCEINLYDSRTDLFWATSGAY